tara:strand:+ start:3492 stop:4163 length:672 start_codon:yes stop_codon:yes gene_type:complete
MNNLTLIIPAKNESESLPKVLEELNVYDFKLSIILHESDTKTIDAVKKFNAEIVYQKNHGYGDALIHGIKNCKTDLFCIFNADGSFDPKEISLMVNLLSENNLDFVFGSRYQKNSGSEDDTIVTLIGNFVFTTIGKIFFKLPITDILYTFVLGKTNMANDLNLNQKSFSFCVELPIKAIRKKMKMMSIDCFERKRIAGKKKVNAFKDGLIILIYMVKLFFLKN